MYTEFNFDKMFYEWRNLIIELRAKKFKTIYTMFEGLPYGNQIITGLRTYIEKNITGPDVLMSPAIADEILLMIFKQSFMAANQLYVPPFILQSQLNFFIRALNNMTVPTDLEAAFKFQQMNDNFVPAYRNLLTHVRLYPTLFSTLPQYAQHGLYIRSLNDSAKLLVIKLGFLRCALKMVYVPTAPLPPPVAP
jgi:hypothetical protein